MPRVKLDSNRPIKLRRLLQLNDSSIGIVIPKSFAARMDLRASDYMSCEMNSEGTSITLTKCGLAMPGLTNVGEEEV